MFHTCLQARVKRYNRQKIKKLDEKDQMAVPTLLALAVNEVRLQFLPDFDYSVKIIVWEFIQRALDHQMADFTKVELELLEWRLNQGPQ